MLGSISPVGEARAKQRWWLTASAYLAGVRGCGRADRRRASAASGRRSDAPSGRRRRAPRASWRSSSLRRPLLDSGLLGWRLPTWHRQVDERWLGTYRGWVYGAGFGFQLGLGIATIIPAAVTYAMLAAAATDRLHPCRRS